MPGINLIFNKEGVEFFKSTLTEKLLSCNWDNRYFSESYFETNSLFISGNRYENYPIYTFENDDFLAVIEGFLYNEDAKSTNDELVKLHKILCDNTKRKEAISKWLTSTDGDFIIVIRDKKTAVTYLLNDVFARLPLYYYLKNNCLIVSREQNRITELADIKNIDKIGTAQFMMLGYTVGNRTLVEECNYFLPGSLLLVDENKGEVKLERNYVFNFESMVDNNTSYKKHVEQSVELFKKATSKRQHTKNIIGLSGGLDSRAVAAAFDFTRNCQAISRLSVNKKEQKDVKLAKKIAAKISLPFKVLNTEAFTGNMIYKLALQKMGLNSLENAFNFQYEEKLLQQENDFVYFTGDGGDRIKPHITFSKKLKNYEQLMDAIIEKNSVLPYKYIEDITGVTIDCVRNDIISFLQSFPEQSLEIKYIHFMIYESAFKSVFEGEDRKRFYFWTVTPFYATDFFIKSMSIPENYKKNYKFYKDFLIKMDKRVADIENAAWGFPISSYKLNLFLYSKNVAKMLPFQIKKYIQADVENLKKTHHTNLLLFLSELINSEDFPNDFNNKGLSYFKDNISKMNTTVIYKIITPIIVSQLLQKKSNLNTRYANIEFI